MARGLPRAAYAWRIDTWPEVEDIGTIEPPETVVTGPRDAPDDLIARLAKNEGVRFRLKDDDGLIYCKGRILYTDPDNVGETEAFGPLDDYGTPAMGCTSLEYWEKDPKTEKYSWVVL